MSVHMGPKMAIRGPMPIPFGCGVTTPKIFHPKMGCHVNFGGGCFKQYERMLTGEKSWARRCSILAEL